MALDTDNDRLFVAEFSGRVLSVDMLNGNRKVVSDRYTGNGPNLGILQNLIYDDLNNVVWVTDTRVGGVMQIEPVSGDRAVILK
jgi:hypothetical protein